MSLFYAVKHLRLAFKKAEILMMAYLDESKNGFCLYKPIIWKKKTPTAKKGVKTLYARRLQNDDSFKALLY